MPQRSRNTLAGSSGRQRGGFVLLELLLVMIVIAILAGGYFSREMGSPGSQSTYQRSMSRTDDAVCKANRSTLMTQIHMFKMNNPNTPATTANMRTSGYNPPVCPDGGKYTFQADGRIICSRHEDGTLAPELVEEKRRQEKLAADTAAANAEAAANLAAQQQRTGGAPRGASPATP